MELTTSQALALRMRSLLLTPPRARDDVAGIVEWFGAMQAQDMASGLWSLGVRLPGRTDEDVRAALERREAIRTWPMRGTVHLVPPADARWMLELMGTRVLAGAAKRRETIGLSEATADRGVEVLATVLKGNRLTRAECLAAVAEAGVELGPQMGYHLLWYASQLGVTCIAPHIGKEQTFVLLDEWAPEPRRPERAEALGIMALRYFRSHGPASRADFARWTGLTMTDTRAGIAAAGDRLTTVRVDGTEMIVDPALLDRTEGLPSDHPTSALDRTEGLPSDHPTSALDRTEGLPLAAVADDWVALPGFDEYMLGYKDRTLMMAEEHLTQVVPGGNGVFRAPLVRGGRVVATWTRTLGRKAVTIDIQPVRSLGRAERARAEEALQPYAAFLGLPAQVRWP